MLDNRVDGRVLLEIHSLSTRLRILPQIAYAMPSVRLLRVHDVASCTANITSHLHTTISPVKLANPSRHLRSSRYFTEPVLFNGPHHRPTSWRSSGSQHVPKQHVAVRIEQTLTVVQRLLCTAQMRLCVAGWQVVLRNLYLFVGTLPLRMVSHGSQQTL
jgi:hypothetical protein